MSANLHPANGPRFLLYSHDGMGLGHTRRNLAIAAALVELCPRASVILASGTDDAHRLGLPPRVEVLKLPGLRKAANDDYQSRRLLVNTDDIRDLRACLLEAAVKSFRPDVVLVDKHPFGARGEFRAGLQALKEQGGRVVLGLRDILDEPSVVRREWAEHQLQDRIAEFHDRIFIYGDRSVFDPIAEYGLPEAVEQRSVFCGYVVNHDQPEDSTAIPATFLPPKSHTPVVLATTGGGEDGFSLLKNFIAAAAGAPWQGVAIAGPMTPDHELGVLRALAAQTKVILHTFIPRMPTLFDSIDAIVCMGGYNTLIEAAFHGVPAVCVPRVNPRSEQLIRAQAFDRLGILHLLHPDDMNPESLEASIRATLRMPRSIVRELVQATLSFEGAQNAALELAALAAGSALTREPAIATVP